MAKQKALLVGGEKIKPGESREFRLHFSESYLGEQVFLPVRVIRARKPGPTVCLTGGVHGDELTGIGIVRGLLYDNPPELLRGTLICVPVVNIYGLETYSRYLPDRRDLNRCFPGTENGSMSSRLAYSIYNEIVRKADYAIDFHSAAVRRTNYPNVRADMKNARVRELARMFGTEVIVNSKGPEATLRRTAVNDGIPTIILEAGEVWKIEPGIVEIGLRGCLNVLRKLEMVEGEWVAPLFSITVERTTWVRAQRGGFLAFHVKPGDFIDQGQTLASNYSIFGRERSLLEAPSPGIVLGMTTMPAVNPGDPVFHIATLTPTQLKRLRKTVDKSKKSELYHRLVDDLSTNITIMENSETP